MSLRRNHTLRRTTFPSRPPANSESASGRVGKLVLPAFAPHTGQNATPGGFTIIELLVSISIIALLTALILPAVVNARSAARRIQCRNNLHNLGIAMVAEAEARRRFPAAGNFGPELPFKRYHSWAVNLLPWLDRKDVQRSWDLDKGYDEPPNLALATLSLSVLVCPDDITALSGQGNLSYVVNGGFGWTLPVDCPGVWHFAQGGGMQPLDLNGNGITCTPPGEPDGIPSDRQLFFQTGLFFVENWPLGTGTVRHHSTQTVHDGLSNTLMIAENVRAGYDPNAAGSNWANPIAWRTCFFLSGYVCENGTCSPGNVDYRRANDRTRQPYRSEAINSSLDQPEGEAPWPSSFHSGDGVHVVFADGRVHFLSERIDGPVYAALVSPQGTTIEGPLAQPLVSDSDF